MWILWTFVFILYFTCENNCHGVFRLGDLQKTYSKVYPKRQYINPNFTKGAPNVNVQIFGSIWRRCQEPSYFSSEQFQQLKIYYGEEILLKETIKYMLYQPRGRIFSGDNYETTSEDYHIALGGSAGCFNLKETKPLRLVETWGKCIRVFKYPDCFGWMLAIYPGSLIPQKLLKVEKFTEIKSIGPCLPDEFLSSSLKADKAEVLKNPQFKDHNPDLIELPRKPENYLSFRFPDKMYRNVYGFYYTSGPKRRMQDIYVDILKENINDNQTTKIWMFNEKFHGNETEEGGVLIYVIPPKFGGPTSQSWNVFVGSKSTAEIWANVSSNFPSPSSDFEKLEFVLSFVYEDENGIRPLFFYYYAWAEVFISYGRVLNGQRDNLRAVKNIDQLNGTNDQKKETEDVAGTSENKIHIRLGELLRSEEITRDGNSSIRNVNHKENQVWTCSVEARENLTQFQENYLQNESQEMKEQSEAIYRMVQNPARFYSGVNYTGDFEDFIPHGLSTSGNCYNLDNLKKRVKSIASFGSCIRIFWGPYCFKQSLVFHDGSMKNNDLFENLSQINLSDIQSVGNCLEDEMSSSYFTPNQNFVPKSIFPPLITFHHWEKFLTGKIVSHGSILRYKLGPRNRTEHIYARIVPDNYVDFENFNKDKFPVCFKNQEGEQFCYAIPPILNGPTSQPYNIFEASEDAMEDWIKLISDGFQVEKRGLYIFSLNFEYGEINSTRPTWIFYHLADQRRGTLFGQVFNGLRSNSSNYPRGNWRNPRDDELEVFSLLRSQL